MPGINIKHRKYRSCMALMPLMHKPLVVHPGDSCPTCHVPHAIKTVHLALDANGTCIVSEGVLADLKKAGYFDSPPGTKPLLSVVNTVALPPTLKINQARIMVDYANRKQTLWGRRARAVGV